MVLEVPRAGCQHSEKPFPGCRLPISPHIPRHREASYLVTLTRATISHDGFIFMTSSNPIYVPKTHFLLPSQGEARDSTYELEDTSI